MRIGALSCVALLILSLGGNAEASTILVIAPPTNVSQGPGGTGESDDTIFAFQESTNNAAGQAVDHLVGGTEIAIASTSDLDPGTVDVPFDSWLFHFDPTTDAGNTDRSVTGTVTFDGDILGLILLTSSLRDSDAALGNPGTGYPSVTPVRGLEFDNNDRITASVGDNQRSLSFDSLFANNTGFDQVRVLTVPGATVVPEPTSIAGLLPIFGLAGACRRRRR